MRRLPVSSAAAALCVLISTPEADGQELSAHQKQACGQYLSVPNIDPAVLQGCLQSAQRAQDAAAASADIARINPDGLLCPCTDANVQFTNADVGRSSECRGPYVAMKRGQIFALRGLTDSSSTASYVERFAECVRARRDKAKRDEASMRELGVQAEEEKRFRLLVVAASDDPAVRQLTASAQLCVAQRERADILRRIAEEHRYAKQAGVVNLADLEDLKNNLREEDGHIASAISVLRRTHRPAFRCSASKVVQVIQCADDERSSESCSTDDSRVAVAVFRNP